MNLEAAVEHIRSDFAKMNEAYGRPVFDELAILGLEPGEPVLHFYEGPREADFLGEFADDSVSLRRELTGDQTDNGGEFSFTREGEGEGFDAYICLGPRLYLFCNNTRQSMQEVTRDPGWLDAQGEFLNASQRFATDAVVVG